jgi:GAF domain/ANTAR domain
MSPPPPPDDAAPPARIVSLCRRGAAQLNVDGVSVGLVTTTGYRSSLCATDEVSARIEDLQVSLGEGPCVDAWSSGEAVRVRDLAAIPAGRWPVFAPAARDAGAAAIFSIPLFVGTTRLGALDVYRKTAGEVTEAELDGQLELGEAVTRALLDRQGDGTGPGPSAYGAEEHSVELFQASGMVSVQLDVSVDEAKARLRAHAYATDRSIRDVARDVVTRRLRLQNDR